MKEDRVQDFDSLHNSLVSCVAALDLHGKVTALKRLLSWTQNLQKDILCALLETDHDFVQVNQMSEGPLGLLLLKSKVPQSQNGNTGTSSSSVASINESARQVLTGAPTSVIPANACYGYTSQRHDTQSSHYPEELPEVESTTRDFDRQSPVSTTPNKSPSPTSYKVTQNDHTHPLKNHPKRKISEVDSDDLVGAQANEVYQNVSKRSCTKAGKAGEEFLNYTEGNSIDSTQHRNANCNQSDVSAETTSPGKDSAKKRAESKVWLSGCSIVQDPAGYQCNKCGKLLQYRVTAEEHMKQHSVPDRKYLACGSCNFRSAWKHHIRSHVKRHNHGTYRDLSIQPQHSRPQEDGQDEQDNSNHSGNPTSVASSLNGGKEMEVLTESPGSINTIHGFTYVAKHYRCNICGKMTKGAFGAMEHKKQHLVPDGKYLQCDSCDYRGRWRSCMRSHVLKHRLRSFTDLTETSGRQLPTQAPLIVKQAKLVLKKTLHASKLKKKVAVANGPQLTKCSTCGKTYTSATRRIHDKQHLVPCGKFILCKLCPSLYRNYSSLHGHFESKHKESRKGSFWRAHHDLTRLKKQASGTSGQPDAYHCLMDNCTQEFRILTDVQDHIIHHVWGIEEFVQCGYCEKAFKFRSLAHKHIAKAHNDQSRNNLVFVNSAGSKFQAELDGYKEKKVCKKVNNLFQPESELKKKDPVTKGTKSAVKKAAIVWHPCPLSCCSAMYANSHRLKEHAKQHRAHDGKYIHCAHCERKFRWKDSIARHLNIWHSIQHQQLDRDWYEVDEDIEVVGSQHWTTLGTSAIGEPQRKQAKTSAKKAWRNGHIKRPKAKTHGSQRFSCIRCEQTFRLKALLFKHIRVYHLTKSPKQSLDWRVESSGAPTQERTPMEEKSQNETLISETSTAASIDLYIDNAHDQNTGEHDSEHTGMDNCEAPVPEEAENHAQSSAETECEQLQQEDFPVTNHQADKYLTEAEIVDGMNSRTHSFFIVKQSVKCDLCCEIFKWSSQLYAHIEDAHMEESQTTAME